MPHCANCRKRIAKERVELGQNANHHSHESY